MRLIKLTPEQAEQLSPSAWAYLGDAVYELYMRDIYLLPPKRSRLYYQLVVSQVRAETQANHLQSLEPHLSAAEQEILRRGRNATSSRGPKRLDPGVYQQATSLEALVGYLYLTNPTRLSELFTYLNLEPAIQQNLAQDGQKSPV
ncbi:MAG: Mini-ribonuclease 3 [Microcoleaceae cyanobacterium]